MLPLAAQAKVRAEAPFRRHGDSASPTPGAGLKTKLGWHIAPEWRHCGNDFGLPERCADKVTNLFPLGFPKEGARFRMAIKIFEQCAGVGLGGLNAQSVDQGLHRRPR
jgi:hypothetical protein